MFWIILCALFLGFVRNQTPKLNTPRLLVPYNLGNTVEYVLYASNGCFKWFSNNPNVELIFDSPCSNKSLLLIKNRINFALIEAVDHIYKLNCDVIMDDIDRIEIISSTKILYIENTPEILIVKAYNTKNDLFSTLAGIPIIWNLDSVYSHDIISFEYFANSSYAVDDYIIDMEANGFRGDKILVSAHKTGTVRITAKLADPGYQHVKSHSIVFSVIANLIMEPNGRIYAQINTLIAIKLFQKKFDELVEISLDKDDDCTPEYKLQLSSDTHCNIKHGSEIRTQSLGVCHVTLLLSNHDNNDKQHQQLGKERRYHMPTLHIHVVDVSHLDILIEPRNIAIMELDRIYSVVINVFDEASNAIYPSSNVDIKLFELNNDFLEIERFVPNGTIYHVKPLTKGITHLRAEMDAANVIFKEKEITVYDKIRIMPRRIVIPHDPLNPDTTYEIKMKAFGGSGKYGWRSTNESLAVVTDPNKGHFTIFGKYLGESTILAYDVLNPLHLATGMNSDPMLWQTGEYELFTGEFKKIMVLLPYKMNFLIQSSKIEAYVGEFISLNLAVIGKSLNGSEMYFTHCQNLSIQIYIDNSNAFIQMSETIISKDINNMEEIENYFDFPHTGSCSTIRLKALKSGFSTITAYYSYKSLGIDLKTSIQIAAYDHMQIIKPKEDIVIAPKTSLLIGLKNGPLPWANFAKSHFIDVYHEKSETEFFDHIIKGIALDSLEERSNINWIRLECLKPGTWFTSISNGNHPFAINPNPMVAQINFTIFCEQPKEIKLIPFYPHTLNDRNNKHTLSHHYCPYSHSSDVEIYPVLLEHPTKVIINMYDHLGRQFYNFTSINLKWSALSTIQDENIGSFNSGEILTSFHNYDLHCENFTFPSTLMESENVSYYNLPTHYQIYYPPKNDSPTLEQISLLDYGLNLPSSEPLENQIAIIQATKHSTAFDDILEQFKLLPLHLDTKLLLRLVSPMTIQPETLNILNYPNSISYLKIFGGSGQFHISQSEESNPIIKFESINVKHLNDGDIVYNDNFDHIKEKGLKFQKSLKEPRLISIIPLKEGQSSLNIHDVCFDPNMQNVKSISITISNIAEMRIHMATKIEVGKSNIVSISFYNKNQREFDRQALPANLKLDFQVKDFNILDMKLVEKPHEIPVAKPIFVQYKIKGKTVGHTTVTFTLYDTNTNENIRQSIEFVQVFDRFSLEPKDITLITDSIFQLKPILPIETFDTKLTFHIQSHGFDLMQHDTQENKFMRVSDIGMITTLSEGTSNITSTLTGYSEKYAQNDLNQKIECKATSTVNVVNLSGIRIKSPILKLGVGNMMPVYLYGIDESGKIMESLFTIASKMDPPFTILWNVLDQNNCVITNNDILSKNNFIVNVLGVRSGPCHITAKLSLLQEKKIFGNSLTSSIQTLKFIGNTLKSNILHANKHFNYETSFTIEVMEYLKLHTADQDPNYPINPTITKSTSKEILLNPGAEISLKILPENNGPIRLLYLDLMNNTKYELLNHIVTNSPSKKLNQNKNKYDDALSVISSTNALLFDPLTNFVKVNEMIFESENMDLDRQNTLKKDILVTAISGGDASALLTNDLSYPSTIINRVDQISHLLLRVRNIVYLSSTLILDDFIRNHYEEQGIFPVGSTIKIRINCHDEYGALFDATQIAIKYRPNRFDVATIEMHYTMSPFLTLKFNHPGQIIIHVSSNKALDHYIILECKDTISISPLIHLIESEHPTSKLSTYSPISYTNSAVKLGTFVCFSNLVLDDKKYNYVWKSGSGHIVLESISGIGFVNSLGAKDNVILTVNMNQSTQTEVDILPFESLNFMPKYEEYKIPRQKTLEASNKIIDGGPLFISDATLDSTFNFPFVTSNFETKIKKYENSTCLSQNETTSIVQFIKKQLNNFYDCDITWELSTDLAHHPFPINIRTLFKASIDYNYNTGIYFCAVKSINENPVVTVNQILENIHNKVISYIPNIDIILKTKHHFNGIQYHTKQTLSYYPPFILSNNILHVSALKFQDHITVTTPSKLILFSMQTMLDTEDVEKNPFTISQLSLAESVESDQIHSIKVNVRLNIKSIERLQSFPKYRIIIFSPLNEQIEYLTVYVDWNSLYSNVNHPSEENELNIFDVSTNLSNFFKYLIDSYYMWLKWFSIFLFSIILAFIDNGLMAIFYPKDMQKPKIIYNKSPNQKMYLNRSINDTYRFNNSSQQPTPFDPKTTRLWSLGN